MFGERKVVGRLGWSGQQNRIIGMGLLCQSWQQLDTNLDVLLQILGTLEALATHVAAVGFEGHMDPDVACDVVSLDGLGVAGAPGAGQAEIVRRFPSNMFLAQMILPSAPRISAETYIKILRLDKRF